MLESQERVYKIAVELLVKQINYHLKQLADEVKELTSSLEFTQREVDDLGRLTWKPHLYHLCMKMSQITGILYKIRNNVTVDCLKSIYISTVYPHLMYCSAIWERAFRALVDRLFVLQKKRKKNLVMSCKNQFDHTNPLFSEHNLLKVPDKIALQTCIFVLKSIYIYLNNTTYESLSLNVINTRRHNDLRIPFCRTVHAQKSVSVRSAREWNSLPQDI